MQDGVAQAAVAPRRVKLPALSRNAWLLLTISAANSLALAGVGSLVNPYLRDLGMSPAFVGLYFSVTAAVQGCASFAGGFVADSLGRRRIWLFGKGLQICGYLVLAAGVRGPAILVAAVLAGLSQIAIGAMAALQAEASQATWRATFFAVVQTVSSLIAGLAPLAGGLVADRYGARWAFFLVLPILLCSAWLISRLEEKVSARGLTGETTPGHGSALLAAVSARVSTARARFLDLSQGIIHGPYPRTAIVLLVYNLINGASNGMINIALPLLLRDRFGMGYTGISALQTASALGTAMTMIIGARIADRHGRRKVMLFALLSGVTLCYGLPFLTSAVQYYALIFCIGLVANSANGAFMATSMDCVTPESRATFGGMSQGLVALGMAVGSLGAGLAYAASPVLPVFLAAGLFSLGAVLMFLFLQETGTKGERKAVAAQD